VIRQSHDGWKGAVAGALGGVVGVLAMSTMEMLLDYWHERKPSRPVRELSLRGGRHDIAGLKDRARLSRLPQEDATVKAADRFAMVSGAGRIKRGHRHMAGLAVHYGFGACVGAAYGLAVGKRLPSGTMSGLVFGGAVWLFAEELALPLTGLTERPGKYRVTDHLNALAAHLVFGFTTELVSRWSRHLLFSPTVTVQRRDDRHCASARIGGNGISVTGT
jgi:hypothetical protein